MRVLLKPLRLLLQLKLLFALFRQVLRTSEVRKKAVRVEIFRSVAPVLQVLVQLVHIVKHSVRFDSLNRRAQTFARILDSFLEFVVLVVLPCA